MAVPYQHLFDAAAQETGNLYCLWRARGMASTVDLADRLALEVRLKRQLALLGLAPRAAGLSAVQTAVAAGSDGDWVIAGWYCAADAAALDGWARRAATPLARESLAAGIACAPSDVALSRISEWSRRQEHAELIDELRRMLDEGPAGQRPVWLTAPVPPPGAESPPTASAVRTRTEPEPHTARVAGSAG